MAITCMVWLGTISCSVITGNNPDSILDPRPGTNKDFPAGYVAVVFLNHSSKLVQTVISVEYDDLTPQIWATPVTPNSWDSLLIDYPLKRIQVIAVTPVDLETGLDGEQVLYEGGPFDDDIEITCGSIVVVETADDASEALTLSTRTIPDQLTTTASTSAQAPGASAELTLVRPEVPDGVTANINATWDNGQGQIFTSTWRISGIGAGVAALVECPVTRIGWGNLRETDMPGATIEGQDIELAAPEPLQLATDGEASSQTEVESSTTFCCGDVVTLRLLEDANAPEGFHLETTANAEESGVPEGGIDLFGNIRQLLDNEGLAGRLSNSGLLLPSPVEPSAD